MLLFDDPQLQLYVSTPNVLFCLVDGYRLIRQAEKHLQMTFNVMQRTVSLSMRHVYGFSSAIQATAKRGISHLPYHKS